MWGLRDKIKPEKNIVKALEKNNNQEKTQSTGSHAAKPNTTTVTKKVWQRKMKLLTNMLTNTMIEWERHFVLPETM